MPTRTSSGPSTPGPSERDEGRSLATPIVGAVAIAVAASASFATPVGYQTNLMVLRPGGYQFADFARIGVPLTLVAGAVVILAAIAIATGVFKSGEPQGGAPAYHARPVGAAGDQLTPYQQLGRDAGKVGQSIGQPLGIGVALFNVQQHMLTLAFRIKPNNFVHKEIFRPGTQHATDRRSAKGIGQRINHGV